MMNYRLRRIAAGEVGNLPPPKRPVKPACLGQLSGDHVVKYGASSWPTVGIQLVAALVEEENASSGKSREFRYYEPFKSDY